MQVLLHIRLVVRERPQRFHLFVSRRAISRDSRTNAHARAKESRARRLCAPNGEAARRRRRTRELTRAERATGVRMTLGQEPVVSAHHPTPKQKRI